MTEEHQEHHTEHKSEHKSEHAAHNSMPEIPPVSLKNVKPESLKTGLNDVIGILKLDGSVMDRVAHRDGEGINIALVYLVIGVVAAPIGSWLLGYPLLGSTIHISIIGALVQAVLGIVMSALVLYITNLVAEKMFQGQAKFPQYFRVMGYAYLLNIVGFLSIVPVLSMIAGIWILVVNYMTLTKIHKLNSTNAVLTIIVTLIALFVVSFVVAFIIGILGLSVIGASQAVSLGN